MNTYRKTPIVKLIRAIALLVTLVAGSAPAQTTVTAQADGLDDRSEGTTEVTVSAGSAELSLPSGLSLMSANGWVAAPDEAVTKEFTKAWIMSGDGTTNHEGVVLIFRMEDGSYKARLQPFSNQYRKCTFVWNPAAIAIVHTHPNNCDPKPAEQDKRLADKFGVPNFTITISGMYVYDPATKKTSKLANGLDWLDRSALP
jgi:hypothetical protein